MHLVYYLLLPRMKFVGGDKTFKIPLEKLFQHQALIHTDVSNLGWGAHHEDQTINGRWSDSEKTLDINWLELLAIKLAIKLVRTPGNKTSHKIIFAT